MCSREGPGNHTAPIVAGQNELACFQALSQLANIFDNRRNPVSFEAFGLAG